MSFRENRRGENRILRMGVNELLSVIYKFIVIIAVISV
jgi:hypothetical protein